MRRRNLMRSRVYRSDSNGKSISSTFNQKNQITPTEYINTDMSFKSSKNPQQRVIKTNINIIFSLDISCSKLYNVMNDIPVESNIGIYGVLQDLFIEKIYYKNLSGTKDCLDGLSNIEILTYTKWITLHFIVLSNNITPVDITINGWDLVYEEVKRKTNKYCNKRSIFRLPIKGYRKELISCKETFNDGKNIYIDNYAKSKIGSGCKYDASGNVLGTVFSRTKHPIIRSGMLDDGKSYRSYREYLRNGKMASYDRSLEKNRADKNDCTKCLNNVYYKSSENKDRTLRNSEVRTIYNPSNKKFKVQGAVSSGSRIDRLKLDTITGINAKCKDKSKDKCLDMRGCDPYFAGKPRFTGWMYNKKHPETVCYNKRQRPRGIPQHQKYRTPSTIKCCNKCTAMGRLEGCKK
tara:strand:+ start:1582 stop:2799 length:1218 start_codon:yes stop_codon:yes gene_type:complete